MDLIFSSFLSFKLIHTNLVSLIDKFLIMTSFLELSYRLHVNHQTDLVVIIYIFVRVLMNHID